MNVFTRFDKLKRAITLIEFAPSPYFSIINVYLEDINVFTRFDKIPSLPVENIKEKSKRRGWMDADNLKTV